MHGNMNLDKNIQEGFILSLEGDIAYVRVAPNADCDNCGQCNIVHLELYAYNAANAKIGQKVKFVMADGSMIRIAFMVFMFPLISILTGIYAGSVFAQYVKINSSLASFLGVTIFLPAAIFFVYTYDKKFKHNRKNFPYIIEVIR